MRYSSGSLCQTNEVAERDFRMTRMTAFSSPYLLGFDQMESILERIAKAAGDSYPPYNVERLEPDGNGERLDITLAVAGFKADDIDVTLESSTLTIRGTQKDDAERQFLHRGIAARRFERSFVLADGMDVVSATAKNGLLVISLLQPLPNKNTRRIPVTELS